MEGITRLLRASMPKTIRKSWKTRPQTLQNGGLGPPKSSPELSKTPLKKSTWLKKVQKSWMQTEFAPKWLTWLHLGGPRPSQIEVKTWKNRCWKSIRFRHRFFHFLDFVLEGFWMIFGRTNAWKLQKHAFRENLKNIDFPEGKFIFSRFPRLKISKVWATMA